MNYYYVSADLAEEIPSYDFVVKAEDYGKARKEAEQIVARDYPDYEPEIHVEETTAGGLLRKLTLN